MEITPTRPVAAVHAADAPVPNTQKDNLDVARATRSLNQGGVAGSDRQFSFSVDPKTKIAVVRIVDVNTGELLDQVPNDYILQVAQQLEDLRSTKA